MFKFDFAIDIFLFIDLWIGFMFNKVKILELYNKYLYFSRASSEHDEAELLSIVKHVSLDLNKRLK